MEDRSLFEKEKSLPTTIFEWIYIFLFWVLVANVIVTGPDRFLSFAVGSFSISFRIIIAFLLLIFFLINCIINKTIPFTVFKLRLFLILFIFSFVFSFVLGSFNVGISLAFSDSKNLLFFALVFPSYDLFEKRMVSRKQIFYFSSLFSLVVSLLCLAFFVYLSINQISQYDINSFWASHYPSTGFGFRPNYGVYFDGLFFSTLLFAPNLYIAFTQKSKTKRCFSLIVSVINLLAVLQSQTRSYYLLIVLASIWIVCLIVSKYKKEREQLNLPFFSRKFAALVLSAMLLAITICFLLAKFGFLDRLFQGDNTSDSIREQFIKDALVEVFSFPFFIGKGFGFQLPSKGSFHLEISLLEILLKQGFLGFTMWAIPFVFAFFNKIQNIEKIDRDVSLLVVFSVYFLSLFNPYLTSVSGIFTIILGMSVFLVKDDSMINKESEKVCIRR